MDASFDATAFREEMTAKAEVAAETKANEIMNTGAAGFGHELIPTNVYTDPLLDLIPEYSRLLTMFPGNHGNNMPISAKVPVIGEADLFIGNTEWTATSTQLPTAPSDM